MGNTDVVDNQAGRLITKHAIDPCDGLHQTVTLHRFVYIHGMHGWCVEASQPHVAHDHQLQRIVRVFRSPGQQIAPGFVANMRLPLRRVAGRAGHHDLDSSQRIVSVMPVRAKFDDFLIQINADFAAHAHHHRLAIQRSDPLLEVCHQVLCHQGQSLLAADQPFNGGSTPLVLFLFIRAFVLQQGLDLGIQLGLFVFIQFNTCQPRFVIDRYCRPIFDCTANVVDVDVMAKQRRSVHVSGFDGRTGEADERSIGQRIAHVFRKAIGDFASLPIHLGLQPVLAAVRFVGDDHHIAAFGQRFAHFTELLQSGEDHATGGTCEQFL
ncbi:hypothetical protein D3C71_1138460 [compost metagenome]